MTKPREQAAMAGRRLRANAFGLAVVYLAHGLPYFWVMERIVLTHNAGPVGLWLNLNVLLNGLLAPTLLLLAIHTLRRRWLSLPCILIHHLLFADILLLFMLYIGHFKTLPTLFLAQHIGNVPAIFQPVIFHLMGFKEWFTLAALGASLCVSTRWARRRAISHETAKPFSFAAGALVVIVIAAFTVKEIAIGRMLERHPVPSPIANTFKIRGFLPQLAKQYELYRAMGLEQVPWPGKISAASRLGAVSRSGAAARLGAGSQLGAAAESVAGVRGRQNVLIVQLESLDKWVIDRKVDGRYVMPNLRAVISQSRYFENFFAMHAGGLTSDAELSALTGLLPQQYIGFGASNLPVLPSLARTLSARGYRTIAMHGPHGGTFYRGSAYPQLGFDQFLEQDAYADAAAGWRSKDLEFFRQSWPRITALPEPFFAYMIAMQGHFPFDNYAEDTLPAAALGEGEPGDEHGEVRAHYIRTHHEVDQAIGFLWERLQSTGLLERTIVLLYADHPSYTLPPPDCFHRECIPFLIHAPGVPAGLDSTLGSHIDITPTILALLNIPEEPETWLGTSLLGVRNAEGFHSAEGSAVRKVLFRDGASILRDPTADGGLILRQDKADRKYLLYSDATLGGPIR